VQDALDDPLAPLGLSGEGLGCGRQREVVGGDPPDVDLPATDELDRAWVDGPMRRENLTPRPLRRAR